MDGVDRVMLVASEGVDGGLEAWRLTSIPRLVGRVPLPWACAIDVHPRRPLVYAASSADCAVVAVEVGRDGAWALRGRVDSGASLPCDVTLDPSATRLAVAHYEAGAVALHDIGAEGEVGPAHWLAMPAGSGPESERQLQPHPHQACFTASGDLWVSDLGGDRLLRYARDRTAPDVLPLSPGVGPRHFRWLDEDRVAVVEELTSRLSIHRLVGDRLVPIASVAVGTAAVAAGRSYPSDLAVSPTGRHVYVANRGADTISVVEVGDEPALVQEVEVGRWPLNLLLGQQSLWCAARDDDLVQELPLSRTGLLGPPAPVLEVPRPSWIEWSP